MLCCTGKMFVFGTFGTCGTFGTFGTCLALDCSEHLANIDQNQSKNCQNQPKTPKVNMLKSGDVSFDFGFEWCLGLATGYVAKISMLILATYPVAKPRHHSKPKSKLTSPDFNMLTFGVLGWFWQFLDWFWSMLAKCSEQSRAKHVPNVPNVPHVPNVPNTNIFPVQHSICSCLLYTSPSPRD